MSREERHVVPVVDDGNVDGPAVSGEVGRKAWWHPIECVNQHDEGGNCLDEGGSIIWLARGRLATAGRRVRQRDGLEIVQTILR